MMWQRHDDNLDLTLSNCCCTMPWLRADTTHFLLLLVKVLYTWYLAQHCCMIGIYVRTRVHCRHVVLTEYTTHFVAHAACVRVHSCVRPYFNIFKFCQDRVLVDLHSAHSALSPRCVPQPRATETINHGYRDWRCNRYATLLFCVTQTRRAAGGSLQSSNIMSRPPRNPAVMYNRSRVWKDARMQGCEGTRAPYHYVRKYKDHFGININIKQNLYLRT